MSLVRIEDSIGSPMCINPDHVVTIKMNSGYQVAASIITMLGGSSVPFEINLLGHPDVVYAKIFGDARE